MVCRRGFDVGQRHKRSGDEACFVGCEEGLFSGRGRNCDLSAHGNDMSANSKEEYNEFKKVIDKFGITYDEYSEGALFCGVLNVISIDGTCFRFDRTSGVFVDTEPDLNYWLHDREKVITNVRRIQHFVSIDGEEAGPFLTKKDAVLRANTYIVGNIDEILKDDLRIKIAKLVTAEQFEEAITEWNKYVETAKIKIYKKTTVQSLLKHKLEITALAESILRKLLNKGKKGYKK